MPPRRRRVDDDGPQGGGRPSILSPGYKKQREKFLGYVRTGSGIQDAARAARLGYSTVIGHCRRGREARRMEARLRTMRPGKARDRLAIELELERPYLDFNEAVEEAKAESKVVLIERWHKASRKHWQAARALLRARYPQEFAPDVMIRLLIAKLEEQNGRNLPGVHVAREVADLGAIPEPGLLPSTGLPGLPPGITPRRAGDEGAGS